MFGSAISEVVSPWLTRLVACLFTSAAVWGFSTVGFADAPIEFDVPAMLAAREITTPDGGVGNDYQVVEIVIPVTSEIRSADRKHIDEFRFDVSWNRKMYPVVDYGPKSQTTSNIEGLVSVDQSRETGGSLGLTANADPLDLLSLNGKGDYSNRETNRRTFQEIPAHQTVVASGTIRRGTGAFFRFHPSRTETLEGGREVVIAYRVSRQWSGGVLKIECRAMGQKKFLGAFSEPIDVGEAFVVPVYLQGNKESLDAAVSFVQTEIQLKQSWTRLNAQKTQQDFRWPVIDSLTRGKFPLYKIQPPQINQTGTEHLPSQWVHRLIQSGDDRYLTQYQHALPAAVRDRAAVFVSARQKLTALSK